MTRYEASVDSIVGGVTPETGMAIIFLQRVVLQAGEEVVGLPHSSTAPVKYILSDVMFRRVDDTEEPLSEEQQKGLDEISRCGQKPEKRQQSAFADQQIARCAQRVQMLPVPL